MFYAWKLIKKGKEARRKITPPKSRWDPTVKVPTFRDHPLYDKLKRVLGLGTNVNEILEFFVSEGIVPENQVKDYRDAMKDTTELEKFEILDYMLALHLFSNQDKGGRTLGEAAGLDLGKRIINMKAIDSTADSWSKIEDYFPISKLGRRENPNSHSDFSQRKENALHRYVEQKVENNVMSKFEHNFIGPNKEVDIELNISPEPVNAITDGIARTVIGLLRSGSQFGFMRVNKDGRYIRGEDRIKYEVERESSFPNKPHKDEVVAGSEDRRKRWQNTPTDEDTEKEGWQQHLERTPLPESDKDWSISSVIKRGTASNNRMKKWYFNGIAVFHGKEPKFWIGMKVKWDVTSTPETRRQMKAFINLDVLNWRKW
jgi:hypothetical protein